MEEIRDQSVVTSFEEKEPTESSIVIFGKILRRFLALIVICTVIGTAVGLGIALVKSKTTYTQSKSVLLVSKLDDKPITTGISLSNRSKEDVQKMISMPVFVETANQKYLQYCIANYETPYGSVSGKAISVGTSESLVFTVSYSDYDEKAAEAKLDAVIEAANAEIENYMSADDAQIIPLDVKPVLSVSNSFAKYLLFGVFGGLAVGVLLALFFYVIDNRVTDKADLERFTGTTVIAYIEDVPR